MKIDISSLPQSPTAGRIWSPEQLAFLDAVSKPGGSILLIAVAGSGKTTTLVEATKRMNGRIALCAYNKKISDEIKTRITDQNVRVGTFHSFGFASWKSANPRSKVSGKKLDEIIDDVGVPWKFQAFVSRMVSLAKQSGIGIPGLGNNWSELADHHNLWETLQYGGESEAVFDWCYRVMQESMDRSEDVIDFDDMLFEPLRAGIVKAEYDWVLIDEAQDTNVCRRLMASHMLKYGAEGAPTPRVVAVGDPHQAIYGFTGADNDSLELIKQNFGCIEMPLTTTYRCPKAVVRHAQQWVSHIHAAESAPEGEVREIEDSEFRLLNGKDLIAGVAVLCRNTKPLVATALRLARANIPCRVEGRELGQGLYKLAQRVCGKGSLRDLESKLEDHRAKECRRFREKKQQSKIDTLNDQCDSLLAIFDSLDPGAQIYDLKAKIDTIFGDSEAGALPDRLILSTVHKAKGREWDVVYLYGRDQYMPSKWATQDWEKEQEKNLIYVAVTRAKKTLVEVRTKPREEV